MSTDTETPVAEIPVKGKEKVGQKATHAVLYTDGGCKPSRGIGGWGIHGFLYYPEEAKQGTGNPKVTPTPTGYIPGGGKPAITVTHYVDGFGSLIPESTNNIAEMTAALRAMECARHHGITNLLIKMDSAYTLDGMSSWMYGWARQGWSKPDGSEIANVELWKQLFEVRKDLEDNGVTIKLVKVKGHSGVFGNDIADQNASRGIVAGRNGISLDMTNVRDSRGYWNTKSERSRLFSHPTWLFGAQNEAEDRSPDGRFAYYLGDPREEDELLGKKIADATFSVLYLKEPEAVLETIRKAVAAMGQGRYQGLSMGHLPQIFHADVYPEIQSYGDTLLSRDYENQRVLTAAGQLLTKEIRPARLAYHAIDALQSLEQLLQEYLNPIEGTRLRTTDLTALLYESDTSKKKPVFKLKSHITSAMRSLKVDANYAIGGSGTGVEKLTLTLGLDLPDRNTLAALAGETTKATLLTWPESATAIRYASVIEADGDVGIWSGVYANLHMLAS